MARPANRVATMDYEVNRNDINSTLIDWNAMSWDYKTPNSFSTYVDFYDEKSYAWFILRWS